MRAYGVIPARLASTRLPRKLLLAETGRPLLQYTYEAALRAKSLSDVLIAADSPEIVEACRRFGARCELTGEHQSGTDRIAEVVRRTCPDADLIVNIQGDEPDIDPASIDLAVNLLRTNPNAQISTLAATIRTREQLEAPSCVKVVCAADGRALYFSRHPIPFVRDVDPSQLLDEESPWRLHIGLYAYRREFLLDLTRLPPSKLEQLEKLEQLRALEAGATIFVGHVAHHAAGIDTPEDYARFVTRRAA
jgi:3-deoxy-manno-octulosonate cytidylyltransferase (CMP-KDO synthetase)